MIDLNKIKIAVEFCYNVDGGIEVRYKELLSITKDFKKCL